MKNFFVGFATLIAAIAFVAVFLCLAWFFTVPVFIVMILWLVYQISCILGDFIMENYDEK
jgi:hypothetical protein